VEEFSATRVFLEGRFRAMVAEAGNQFLGAAPIRNRIFRPIMPLAIFPERVCDSRD
jgi:hypothetical protein